MFMDTPVRQSFPSNCLIFFYQNTFLNRQSWWTWRISSSFLHTQGKLFCLAQTWLKMPCYFVKNPIWCITVLALIEEKTYAVCMPLWFCLLCNTHCDYHYEDFFFACSHRHTAGCGWNGNCDGNALMLLSLTTPARHSQLYVTTFQISASLLPCFILNQQGQICMKKLALCSWIALLGAVLDVQMNLREMLQILPLCSINGKGSSSVLEHLLCV